MSISNSQLETWSHQGAITTAKLTRNSIQFALNSYKNFPENIDYDFYLQGSYKNNTNIWGDMDVDLIIQLYSTFSSNLSESEQAFLGINRASYFLSDFKRDVIYALQEYYGSSNIIIGNKAIKLKSSENRLPADILVCLEYRKYYNSRQNYDNYIPGIIFWTNNESRKIINYPKLHYENGVSKNLKCNKFFKPFVRIFKNIRTFLHNKNLITIDLAPSYFLECLLYNVAEDRFENNYQTSLFKIIKWIIETIYDNKTLYVCQNMQTPLFGNTHEQWSKDNVVKFLNKTIDLLK